MNQFGKTANSEDCGCGDINIRTDQRINEYKQHVFKIENMDCPTEQMMIEKILRPMDGVIQLNFNILDRKLTVDYFNVDIKTIQSALESIGMRAISINNSSENEPIKVNKYINSSVSIRQRWLTSVALFSAIFAEVFAWIGANENAWYVIVLSLLAISISGLQTYKKGWISLKNLNLNINALMSIAVTGAVLIGQWPEAAMVMVLFSIAEMIESFSLERARNAIRGLMAMTPETATIRQTNGEWLEIETRLVSIGMLARIKPGERIPLDGTITKGNSSIDQAPITGESIPVQKTIGEKVFAGTINQTGSFEYKITAIASQSTLARIIKSIEEAQSKRAPTQRFVDQFSKIYTPSVFLLAIVIAILPPLLWGQPWIGWIYKALVILVIACPCALLISTPVTVVSGLAAAAKRGILIKGGVYLENGHNIQMLALDKTGTITSGKPEVMDIIDLAGETQDSMSNNDANDNLKSLLIAASLANRSDHPVSQAITEHIQQHEMIKNKFMEITDFSALVGKGIKGSVNNESYYLGNHRLLEDICVCNPKLEQTLDRLESEGKTVVTLSNTKKPLLIIAVADKIKNSSKEAISALKGLGIRTVMLTGDNNKTAEVIAKNVGVDEFHGELLPQHKLDFITHAFATRETIAMVGDGINDAPALARATIGFAMGAAGTDTAIETADVALMDDDLGKIVHFIKLSKKTSNLLKQNIAFALVVKVIFMALAFVGLATLWMAVFADMGASLIVVANGLRLVRTKSLS